ncbi:MAG TPA: transposase [Enterobacteriaceae bacterium]|nr:transposase [Enterobacteriaceae bacterium]
MSQLKSYIPDDNHALMILREAIDTALAYAGESLAELGQKCESGVATKIIIRAWVLQVVYSVGRAEVICEALSYNMLWRWFVGYTDVWEAVPEGEAFLRDIQKVSAEPRIVEMVHRCLLNNMQMLSDAGQFAVNYGLLNTLRAHYASADPHENQPSESSGVKAKGGGSNMPG